MKCYLTAVLLIPILLSGCKKDDKPQNTKPTDLYICRLPGYVAEPDNRYYRITETGLVIADLERRSESDPSVYDDTLAAHNASWGNALRAIPDKMWQENGANYNNDMLADAPGYRIGTHANGVSYSWYITDASDGLPGPIKEYADKLRQACDAFVK